MKNNNEDANTSLLRSNEQPKIPALWDEINNAINNAETWFARLEIAQAVTWNYWSAQTPDGKKHARTGDKQDPIPWEGASDTRNALVLEKIREADARQTNAFNKANLKIMGREGFDHISAQKATNLLKWMLDDQMGSDAQKALSIGRFNRNACGVNIMGIEWERETQNILESVSFEDFARALGINLPQGATLEKLIDLGTQLENIAQNPMSVSAADFWGASLTMEKVRPTLTLFTAEEKRAELFEAAQKIYPKLSKTRLEEALEKWRDGAAAKIPMEKVVKECPKWTPLIPFVDVFFPTNVEELQRAPWIAVREWMTEQELRAKAKSEDWDKAFVEAVIETKGQDSTLTTRRDLDVNKYDMPCNTSSGEPAEERIEIFFIYNKAVDEDGIETLYRLVASANLSDDKNEKKYIYGINEIYEAPDGKYPFFEQFYWRTDKRIIDNVGLGHMLRFSQQNIKNMRDRRFDAADIAILPPVIRDPRDSRTPLKLGPACTIWSNGSSAQWMNPPNARYDLGIELENSERRDAARLVGSHEAGVDTNLVNAMQEASIINYLSEMRALLKGTWKFIQTYLPPVVVMRMTGGLTMPYQMSAEEISGAFDLNVDFDPANADMALLKTKLDLLMQMKNSDANGIIDTNFWIKYIMQMISPTLAEMSIIDERQAPQKAILEEKQNIALMMTGQSAALKKQESGAKLRLETIMQELQNNPAIAPIYAAGGQADANPATQRIRAAFDQRIANLKMQLMQEQNKTTGALGVNPNLNNNGN